MSTDYEKLGAFYLGREFDPATNALKRRSGPVRLEGPDHARGVRGHDGLGQDRAVPLAARRGRHRRRARHLHRSRRATSATCCSRSRISRPRTSSPGWTRARPRARACRVRVRREDRRDLEERPGRVGPGARAHRAAARRRRRGYLHAGRRDRPAAVGAAFVRARPRPSCWPTPARCATAWARWSSGLLGLLGIEADPIGSREHILLANILEGAWRAGPVARHDRADPGRAEAAPSTSSARSTSRPSSRRRSGSSSRCS